jgi:predicted oxidoreductase
MAQKFSDIIAGTMLWGKWGRKFNAHDMREVIRHCMLNGLTSFDHADIYGDYTTEADFGEAFDGAGINRQDVQFISKCGIMKITPDRSYTVAHYKYDKDYIISCCDRSLRNLRTDYIDLFLMHRPSPLMRGEEIAEAATTLKEQGKILSFGLSNFTPSQTELIRQYIPVEYNQIEFSVTHYHPMLDGSLDHMQLHRIRPMSWGPLGRVFKEDTPQSKRVRNVLHTLEKKYEVEDHILLLNWVLRHPAEVIPVIGTSDIARIGTLRQALQFTMDLEDWFELWQAGMGHPVP